MHSMVRMRLHKHSQHAVLRLASIGMLTLLAACSNIDCPLDNVVMMQCNLYSSESGQALSLPVSLTVKPAGRDTILLNQAKDVSNFLLPLKEAGERDTLLLNFTGENGNTATDTLFVNHTPRPHFESLDCPTAMFHTIHQVRATGHALSILPLTVDSVSLIRSTVNYDDIENLRIFLRSTSRH